MSEEGKRHAAEIAEQMRMLREQRDALAAALTDMHNGWRYIRQTHGDLYGVGWDRCEESASAALAKVSQ